MSILSRFIVFLIYSACSYGSENPFYTPEEITPDRSKGYPNFSGDLRSLMWDDAVIEYWRGQVQIPYAINIETDLSIGVSPSDIFSWGTGGEVK